MFAQEKGEEMRKYSTRVAVLLTALAFASHLAHGVEPMREPIEWANVWVQDADKTDLPRVLIIGDSIVMGYYPEVERRLRGKASCARLATSKCMCDPAFLPEVELLIKHYEFDVIHFNNGLHGYDYTEEQYAESFQHFLALVQKYAPNAKVIWALSTPERQPGNLEQFTSVNARVAERNRLVRLFAEEHDIPINDLNTMGVENPDFYTNDGTHFNEAGRAAQGKQVAEILSEQLQQDAR